MSEPLELAHLEIPAEGAEIHPPLVVAHGLYGSARNFASLGKRLAAGRRVLPLDMRNHGTSPWSDDCSYTAMAADMALAIDRLAGGRAVVLGHSMGGKAAMALALRAPERVAALIVADIAPVAYSHTHRDILEAMQALPLDGLTRRGEADPLLAAQIPEPPLRAFVLQNLLFEGGRARWRLNLAGLAEGMEALLDFPDLAGSFEGPTFFLHGGASDYVTDAHLPAIHARFPAAEIEAIPGAGHWLHAEKPDAFVAATTAWLGRQGV